MTAQPTLGMSLPIPLARQIKCVEREVAMRERAYAGWVERGKMTQQRADEEIDCMRAVLETLKGLEGK